MKLSYKTLYEAMKRIVTPADFSGVNEAHVTPRYLLLYRCLEYHCEWEQDTRATLLPYIYIPINLYTFDAWNSGYFQFESVYSYKIFSNDGKRKKRQRCCQK